MERAHPSGAVAGTYRPADHQPVQILMNDGGWGYGEATGWAQDVSGAWRMKLLRYGTDGAGHAAQLEDWWLYDPARVRLSPDTGPPGGY